MTRSFRTLCLLSAALGLVTASAAQGAEEPGAVEQLTLEEKASLVTGRNTWETAAVDRLGIPAVWMADGPVGLRKSTGQQIEDAVPATCFPSAAGMAATWNPELVEQVGAAIGAEANANDVTLLLAPGLNMKRHPLGGRNFEYYSEDPLLSGRMAAAFARGVQSRGVGATLKHFAVNNQEHRRMSIDARVGERALREIYLRGFQIAVEEGSPQAVMSAYNRVNGTSASESRELLTGILREEWGFDGLVLSDWGAVDDPAAAVAAGVDLEMPGNPLTQGRIVQAVRDGALAEADLDRAVGNVLQLVARQAARGEGAAADLDAHHELARRVAAESLVLLDNDGTLPFTSARQRRIGVAGGLAFEPRIQGIGSSQVQATRIDVPWSHIEEIGSRQGHGLSAWRSDYDEDGLGEDERAGLGRFLEQQDITVIFAGQKASHDAEAWDRPSMDLAPAELELIEAARASGKPFVVVLVGGGAVDVGSFHADAAAVLMGWLGGQGFGAAVARVLFGELAPSGRLSESFARSVSDHASALNFPGGPWAVDYGEGLYVGYRFFQTFDRPVAYPFGHGLSYTSFEYLDAEAPATLENPEQAFEVAVTVRNVGAVAAAETVQVYLRHLEPSLDRPDRELVGFRKETMGPGDAARFVVRIEPERLAYWHDGHHRWVIEPGDYELLVAASAADVRATLPLRVTAGTMPPEVYTVDHTIGDIYADTQGRVVVDFMMEQQGRGRLSEVAEDDFFAAIIRNLPLRKLVNFSGGAVTPEILQGLLFLINSRMPPEQVDAMLRQAAAAQQPGGG